MSLKKKSAVAGVARKSGKFLLAKRKAGGEMGGKWEFPGGKVEKGESPEEALVREFLEEMEVFVDVGDYITETQFIHGETQYRLLAYDINLRSYNIKLNEHDSYCWVEAGEILDYDLADSDRKIAALLIGV